jgi:hypothetical protein
VGGVVYELCCQKAMGDGLGVVAHFGKQDPMSPVYDLVCNIANLVSWHSV